MGTRKRIFPVFVFQSKPAEFEFLSSENSKFNKNQMGIVGGDSKDTIDVVTEKDPIILIYIFVSESNL